MSGGLSQFFTDALGILAAIAPMALVAAILAIVVDALQPMLGGRKSGTASRLDAWAITRFGGGRSDEEFQRVWGVVKRVLGVCLAIVALLVLHKTVTGLGDRSLSILWFLVIALALGVGARKYADGERSLPTIAADAGVQGAIFGVLAGWLL